MLLLAFKDLNCVFLFIYSLMHLKILSLRKSHISIYKNLKSWLTHLIISDVFKLSLMSVDNL